MGLKLPYATPLAEGTFLKAGALRPKKSTRPGTFQGLLNEATAGLQSPRPLPAAPFLAQSCKPPKGNTSIIAYRRVGIK